MASYFEIDKHTERIAPDSLQVARQVASQIIRSQHFVNTIEGILEVGTFLPGALRKTLSKAKFTLSTIRLKADMDAYTAVYLPDDDRRIYFNPLMLLEMRHREEEEEEEEEKEELAVEEPAASAGASKKRPAKEDNLQPSKRSARAKSADKLQLDKLGQPFQRCFDRHVTFLTVKLVREVAHILNFKHNQNMVTNKVGQKHTPPKIIVICRDFIHAFSDFGDMVEFKLFGWVLEHREASVVEESNAFAIADIVLFKTPGYQHVGLIAARNDMILGMIPPPGGSALKALTKADFGKLNFCATGELHSPVLSTGGNRGKMCLPMANASRAHIEGVEEERRRNRRWTQASAPSTDAAFGPRPRSRIQPFAVWSTQQHTI